jgi:hypothetical protein
VSLIRVPAPWRGIDEMSVPDFAGQATAAKMVNMLPGREGQVQVRGSVLSGWATPGAACGNFWPAPTVGGSAQWLMDIGTGYRDSNTLTAAYTGGAGTLGASYALMDGYIVGVTTIGGAVADLLWWDNVGGLTRGAISAGATKCTAVATHQTRLFALGGIPAGGGTQKNNVLYWTDPNPNLRASTVAMWQDDASGLTNTIVLPANDNYCDIVTFNRTLYIIGEKAIYALMGSTPSTYELRKVLDVGSPYGSPGHACATDYGLYFWGLRGLVRFDGATLTSLGDRLFFDRPLNQQIRPLPGGYLSVIRSVGAATSPVLNGRWCLFHEETASWGDLTCPDFPNSEWFSGLGAGFPSCVFRVRGTWYAASSGSSLVPTAGAVRRISEITTADSAAGNSETNAYALSQTTPLAPFNSLGVVQRLHAQSFKGTWTFAVEDEAANALDSLTVVGTSAPRTQAAKDLFFEQPRVRVRWTWSAGANAASFDRPMAAGDVYLDATAAQRR